MKRSGFKTPADFQQAKACYKPLSRKKPLRSQPTERNRSAPKPRKRMKRQHQSPKGAAWSKAVLERDHNRCQWPGGCDTGDSRIDPHHKAERSQRPDLKYDVSIGVALCRTHHDWIPLHRNEAIATGLLLEETYEMAMRSKSLTVALKK